MNNFEYVQTLFEAYIEALQEVRGKAGIYELQNTYLQPILETCLREMRTVYKSRRELSKENDLYVKCSRSSNYRGSYPKMSIGSAPVLIDNQSEEFKKYFELFSQAVGYLRKSTEQERVNQGLRDIVDDTLYRKLGKDLIDEKSRNFIKDLYAEEFYKAFISLKLINTYLVGTEKSYDIDTMCSLIYFGLGSTADKAYLETFYRGSFSERVTDDQTYTISTLRFILTEREQETGEKFRLESATPEQLEDIKARYNQKQNSSSHKIQTTSRLCELLSFEPTILYGTSKQIALEPSIYGNERCRIMDKVEYGISQEQSSEEENDALIEVVNDTKRELGKSIFECLNEKEKYFLVRRLALLSMGYGEEVAVRTANAELGLRYKPDTVLAKVTKRTSEYIKTLEELRNSEVFLDLIDYTGTVLNTDEVLLMATRELFQDTTLMAELSGLDIETVYHGIGCEEVVAYER